VEPRKEEEEEEEEEEEVGLILTSSVIRITLFMSVW
jgi:hypothetical protein